MTALAPETLVKHELVGLDVEVVEATDPGLVGLAGRVVRETTKTLVVATGADADGDDGEEKTVPKGAATFAFTLPDGTVVRVEGARLVARPARRTETAGGHTWQSD